MAVLIKAIRANYTRYGKIISQEETLIEKLSDFFQGCNRTDEVILTELSQDKNVLISESVKTESVTVAKPVKKEEATKKPVKKTEEEI